MAKPPRPQRVLVPHVERELARIRAALSEAIRQSTLRGVALEVGMAPCGLKKFLLPETVPYGPTLSKVRAWYMRWRNGEWMSTDDVDQSIQRLLRWLPDPAIGTPDVLDSILRVHQAAGVAPPPWLLEVRSRYCGVDPPRVLRSG